MAEATIEEAVVGDASALSALALAAKGHWGYPQEWLRQWRQELLVSEEAIRRDRIWLIREGEIPVAMIQLSGLEPGKAEIEAMWVAPEQMGRGLGRRLVEFAMAEAERCGAGVLRAVSDPNARGFYEALGFSLSGWEDSVPAGRRLPVMELTLGQSRR